MDKQHLDYWVGYEGLLTAPHQLEFSRSPHWRNWQFDLPVLEEEIIEETIPPMQRYLSKPLFEEYFNTMFDEENNRRWDGSDIAKKKKLICDGEEKRDDENTRKEKKSSIKVSGREEKKITFEEVSKYFYMPITQAARELNIGLTLLKKKCRELGIPRWPHRKMKSLQTLIQNVQELERVEGEVGEVQLQSTIEILEQERKLMEEKPEMKLEEKTKRLRQACFKANYRKRRLINMAADKDHVLLQRI